MSSSENTSRLSRWSASIGLALIILLVASGCREMIATPPPAMPEQGPAGATRTLLILGLDGEPLVEATIRVSDWGMEFYYDSEDWSGRTDEEGFVSPAVPAGEYWVKVTPREAPGNSDEPVWVEERIWLGDEPVTVDPRARVRHGRLEVPDEFPPGEFIVQLLANVEYEARDLSFTQNTGVRDDGTFETVWVDGAAYSMALGSAVFRAIPRAAFRLDPGSFPDHPDSLVITWEPETFEVRLLLGGDPCPPGYVTATASSESENFEVAVRRAIEGSRFLMPAEIGPMTLRIESHDPLPFVGRDFEIEFQTGGLTTLELGEHEVEFRAVDDRGLPLGRVHVYLEEARSQERHDLSLDVSSRLFLATGNYHFWAETYDGGPGFASTELTADIAADTLITFVLPPWQTND